MGGNFINASDRLNKKGSFVSKSFGMNEMPVGFDFKKRAEKEMVAEGFRPEFPPEVVAEVASVAVPKMNGTDLRSLLWSSIDNNESRDLDQVEWAEKLPNGSIHVMVGIAEVDWGVPRNSATDRHAAFNATSVYTGGPSFPMLPDRLSHEITSLCQDGEREAVVIEFMVDKDGNVESGQLCRAIICNKARLTYDDVQRFLSGDASALPSVPGLPEQIQLQLLASQRLIDFRKQRGALSFSDAEIVPIVVDNRVQGMGMVCQNAAREIIESLMVAANVTVARFLRARGSMAIRRVVRTPKRWDRIQAIAISHGFRLSNQPDSRALGDFLAERKAADPLHFPELSLAILKSMGPGEYVVEHPGTEREGHFGLAVKDYSHSTAPNRRYADLAMQRLVKSALAGEKAPYSETELEALAMRCTERESAARHVERFMKKVAGAIILSSHINEVFDAIVTCSAQKGTFARLLSAPAEGRVIRGHKGLDLGDKVRVKLIHVDPDQGYIDLELAH